MNKKTLEDVKSVIGQAFELVKLLLEAIIDNGGNLEDLKRFLSEKGQSLRTEVARLIIGGVWRKLGIQVLMRVRWGIPIDKLVEDFKGKVFFEPGLLNNYWVGTDRPEIKRITPDKTIFTDLVGTVPEPDSDTVYKYELVLAPTDLFSDQFEKWLLENRERLATDRELLYYAFHHVSWCCRIVALGNRTNIGAFPFLRKREDYYDLVLSSILPDFSRLQEPVFGANIFLLMRCPD